MSKIPALKSVELCHEPARTLDLLELTDLAHEIAEDPRVWVQSQDAMKMKSPGSPLSPSDPLVLTFGGPHGWSPGNLSLRSPSAWEMPAPPDLGHKVSPSEWSAELV